MQEEPKRARLLRGAAVLRIGSAIRALNMVALRDQMTAFLSVGSDPELNAEVRGVMVRLQRELLQVV